MSARLKRALAVALLVAGGPRAASSAPDVLVSAVSSDGLRLVVRPSPGDIAAAAGDGHASTGFLVAVPPGATARLRIVSDSRARAAAGQVSLDRLALLPVRPLRLAERATAGRYQLQRVELAPVTRAAGGGAMIHSELVAELRFVAADGSPAGGSALAAMAAASGMSADAVLAAGGAGDPLAAALRSAVVNPEQLIAAPARKLTGSGSGALPGTCNGCVKVTVSADGLYRVRYEELAALDPVWTGTDPTGIRVRFEGLEVPADVDDADGVFGPGDQLLFFGMANRGLVTRSNVYWIEPPDGGAASRFERRPAFSSGDESLPPVSVTRGLLRFEEPSIFYGKMPGTTGVDPWMSLEIASIGSSEEAYLPTDGSRLDAPDLARPVPGQSYRFRARVVGRIGGNLADDQELVFELNGQLAANQSWQASTEIEKIIDVSFDPTAIAGSGNQVRVVQPQARVPAQIRANFIDWAEAEYPRKIVAHGGRLDFVDDSPSAAYYAGGFAKADARIYLFDGERAVRLIGPRVLSAGPGLPVTLVFAWRRTATASGEIRVVAAEPAALLVPDRLALDTPSNLHGMSGTRYLVVTHPRFLAEAERLASLRSGIAVSIEDVYDEFANGNERPEALRDFLAWALGVWPEAPRYVALVGDASFDPMNNLELAAPDYQPPSLLHSLYVRMESASGLLAASDGALASVIGADFLPDVALGRIPARKAGDLDAYRLKLEAYETQAAAGWMERIELFADDDVNDDGSQCGITGAAAADFDSIIAEYLPLAAPGNLFRRYAGSYSGLTAPQDLQADIKADLGFGMGVQVYLGHGNLVSLGRHCDNNRFAILDRDTLPFIDNQLRQPLGVALTCEAGEFDGAIDFSGVPITQSIAETYLLAPDRGHIAWLATTSVLAFSVGVDLTRDLFSVLYAGDPVGPPDNRIAGSMALGISLRRFAEVGAAARDAVATTVLLGDPAARLRATTP